MKNLDLAQKTLGKDTADASEPPVKAANEDSPTGGALYRMIARRPSSRIPAVATAASFLALGAGAAYVWGFFGPQGIDNMTRPEALLVAGGVLTPLILIWLAAWTVWRGQEMKLMADALARTAIRLTDPADPASDEIISIAQAVRGELDRLKAGLADALAETSRLKALVSEEIGEIDRGTERAETRTLHMEELLKEHRDSLIEIGRRLGTENDTISRGLRQQVDAVRGLIGEAEETLQTAGARIVAETETLARVSEAARASADATASTFDRQASRLEVVAAGALGKADQLTTRYETQRQIIADAANRLDEERRRLEAVFEGNRDQLAAATTVMGERTAEISRAASELATSLNATFDSAAKRAATVRAEISGEVSRAVSEVDEASGAISRSAGAATRAIGATVDELRAATAALSEDVTRTATETIAATAEELRSATTNMIAEVTRASSTLTSDLALRAAEMRHLVGDAISESDIAGERFNAAMIRLGGAARDAGRAMEDAANELETRIARMPNDAAHSAASLNHVLQEQVAALAAIADIVVRHARVLDRAAPSPAANLAPNPAPPPKPADAPRAEPARRWGISDLLAAAGRNHAEPPLVPPRESAEAAADSEFHRSSLQVIETLQALAIDLDRALEQSPPPDLWQRYQAGERNVFARRLYSIAGRQLYDRIAVNYRNEPEFREHVDRFVDLFERLLASAASRDRDNILVETYLSSDTGKVYLMLAQASGKLS
ncbi:MAG: hypothetical protein P4L72_15045 [Parvibaculum sp.]|uniref:hypothetical protein n=1 Tax=Parvibaculum sp. TaxID=2024848 RepID=UPI00284ABAA4|nr:hypothetical protein [Parvibaculum sp.]MDR3500529.1 hypothetical protein [Parvibaculum sp.]